MASLGACAVRGAICTYCKTAEWKRADTDRDEKCWGQNCHHERSMCSCQQGLWKKSESVLGGKDDRK